MIDLYAVSCRVGARRLPIPAPAYFRPSATAGPLSAPLPEVTLYYLGRWLRLAGTLGLYYEETTKGGREDSHTPCFL